MKNSFDVIDYISIAIGSAYSIANIESLLGVVILIVQIIWLSIKIITEMIKRVKNKQSLDGIDDDINDIVEKTKDVIEILDKKEEDKNERKDN